MNGAVARIFGPMTKKNYKSVTVPSPRFSKHFLKHHFPQEPLKKEMCLNDRINRLH